MCFLLPYLYVFHCHQINFPFQKHLISHVHYTGMLCFLTLLVVEIDKRIKFHKVLGLEYMMKVKNYSNTEYLVKSWIMITFSLIFFIIAFFPTLYRLLTAETTVVPAWLRILLLFLWQSFPPAIIILCVRSEEHTEDSIRADATAASLDISI